MKKCLIVYDSYHHGNTRKVAEAMAQATGAQLCPADEAQGKDPGEYEIIGFGAGIAYGRFYEKLRKAAAAMDLKGKTVFVFSTSGTGSGKYNDGFSEELKKAGAAVAGSFTCKGYDTMVMKMFGGVAKGHPDENDLSAAKKFALSVIGGGGRLPLPSARHKER